MCPVAYLVNADWTPSELRPSPVLQDDWTWGAPDPARHLVRDITEVRRDSIFADFFHKLDARSHEHVSDTP